MSTIKSTSINQVTDINSKVAAEQLKSASNKSSAQLFSDPAVTPLPAPGFDQTPQFYADADRAEPVIEAHVPYVGEDHNLRQITQALALRSDTVSATSFSCGSYTRPNTQLESAFKSIAVSLTANHPDFLHHG